MTRAAIIGIGSYLPDDILTNADLEGMVDTSDEWITSRTGIEERHIVAEGEAASHLAVRAGRRALESASVDPEEVDLLIVATTVPDTLFPSAASLTQAALGLRCGAVDVNSACTGFIYALALGAGQVESGRARTVLVVGADALTRVIDFTDRATCVLFGDGAGAVLLRAGEEPGLLESVLGSDGAAGDLLCLPAGGSARPCTAETLAAREHYLRMSGNEVYKFASRIIPKATREVLDLSGMSVGDLRWLVPHQANQRIIDTAAERLGIARERVFSNVAKTGNTSAASIPVALDDLYTSGLLGPGDLVGLVGFGAGLTWGAAIVRWTMERVRTPQGET